MAWFLDTNVVVFLPDVAIRRYLESVGTPISEADMWIAATAQAAGGTLVTNNTGEFSRVPNLALEDWTIP